jgi:hypothetical protein
MRQLMSQGNGAPAVRQARKNGLSGIIISDEFMLGE